MRMIVLWIMVVSCTARALPDAAAADKNPATTLRQDRQKLQGAWRTAGWRQPDATDWQCHVQIGLLPDPNDPRFSLTINLERGGQATSGPVLGALVEQQENDNRRWMRWINAETAQQQKLPREIDYKFEDDVLVLRLASGPCQGDYRLRRSEN